MQMEEEEPARRSDQARVGDNSGSPSQFLEDWRHPRGGNVSGMSTGTADVVIETRSVVDINDSTNVIPVSYRES